MLKAAISSNNLRKVLLQVFKQNLHYNAATIRIRIAVKRDYQKAPGQLKALKNICKYLIEVTQV